LCSYIWDDGIDRLLAVKVGHEPYYALTDVQGTVWGYVDSSNNVVARWTYDAWGNVVGGDVSVPALASLRYRFQGRERSEITGLSNFRMRWYDAETGRWLSKDPIGLGGGLNLYMFCKNDSVNYVDISGLAGWLTIYSNAGDGTSTGNDWGHSWISFEREGQNDLKTFGTWNDIGDPRIKKGLNLNKEKGRPAQSRRSQYIDDDGQLRLVKILRKYKRKKEEAWDKMNPCSHFASDVWFEVTGEKLEDRNILGISLPSKLKESINEANKR